jgi:hypothetical protein
MPKTPSTFYKSIYNANHENLIMASLRIKEENWSIIFGLAIIIATHLA